MDAREANIQAYRKALKAKLKHNKDLLDAAMSQNPPALIDSWARCNECGYDTPIPVVLKQIKIDGFEPFTPQEINTYKRENGLYSIPIMEPSIMVSVNDLTGIGKYCDHCGTELTIYQRQCSPECAKTDGIMYCRWCGTKIWFKHVSGPPLDKPPAPQAAMTGPQLVNDLGETFHCDGFPACEKGGCTKSGTVRAEMGCPTNKGKDVVKP